MLERLEFTLSDESKRGLPRMEEFNDVVNAVLEDEDLYPIVDAIRDENSATRGKVGQDETEVVQELEDGLVRDFLNSEIFHEMNDNERTHVYESLTRFERQDAPVWAVQSKSQDSNLFGYPELLHRQPIKIGHKLMVIGATAMDIARCKPESWQRLSETMPNRIDYANLVGAAVLSPRHESRNESERLERRYRIGDGVDGVITATGSVHGDFQLNQKQIYPTGSINPIGKECAYAPVGERSSVYGYHSCEPTIMTALIQHLSHPNLGLSDTAQKQIILDVLDKFEIEVATDEAGKPAPILFADFGMRSDKDLHISSLKDHFAKPASERTPISNGAWMKNLVLPGSEAVLVVQTDGTDLVLANAHSPKTPLQEAYKTIRLPSPEAVSALMESLLSQSSLALGRSSIDGLTPLLLERLSLK